MCHRTSAGSRPDTDHIDGRMWGLMRTYYNVYINFHTVVNKNENETTKTDAVVFQDSSVTDHNKIKNILGDIKDVRGFINFCLALVEMEQKDVVTDTMGLTIEEVQKQGSMRE